jgi:uncharacterized protein with NRDE domain
MLLVVCERRGNSEAGTYLEEIISRHTEYDGFNTIVGDLVKGELIFYSNKDPTIAVQQVPGKNVRPPHLFLGIRVTYLTTLWYTLTDFCRYLLYQMHY